MGVQVYISITALVASIAAIAIATIQTSRTQELSHLPVLVIIWDGSKEQWYIRNVGNGPALNITVAQHTEDGTEVWYNPVSIPAVAAGDSSELKWLGSGPATFSLGARYSDFLDKAEQHQHFTYSRLDRCSIYPPSRLPEWAMPEYALSDTKQFWEDNLPRDFPVQSA